MSTFRSGVIFMAVALIICGVAFSLLSCNTVKSAVIVIPESHSAEFQKAFFEAARVYGRAGCGDQELAEMTARKAVSSGLPARLIAAMAASESTCNPMAVSNRGAVGLTQIVPKIWGKEFDFTKINLLNPEQNMEVSTVIMSKLVKQYGIKGGLIHYYGVGIDSV